MPFTETYSREEWKAIDSEFRRLSTQRLHYLDHAGAALYSEQQIRDSYGRLLENLYCNPHTNELTERQVDEVREKVLSFFNTNSSDYQVVFTRGATEALKILAETFDFQTTGHFMYLRNCHNSVLGMRAIVNTPNVHVMEVDGFLALPYAENESSSVYSMSNSLVVYPAQCNFNGYKYPLDIVDRFHNVDLPVELQSMSKNWYVCYDAANFVSTSYLDLAKHKPDFVVLSFYKIFGYPTGLGALLVSRRGQQVLNKRYHGGGTVDFALSNVELHRKKSEFHERFEDGTLPFLSIISLLSGFETIQRLVPKTNGLESMERISFHVFRLAQYLYGRMKELKYTNGQQLIRFYNQTEFNTDDKPLQGGIVTFNVHRTDGEFAGFKEVEGLCEMNDVYLRVGCFCNPGACQTNLNLSNQQLMLLSTSPGQSCNGNLDVMDDQPLGFVRVSLGYVTSKGTVDAFLRVLKEYFLGILAIPKQVSNKPQLLQIRVYPLKEAAPVIASSKWAIDENNQLLYEHDWSVVNEFGVNLTVKNCPELNRVRVFVNERKRTLRLMYPQRNHLDLSLNVKDVEMGSSNWNKKLGFENQSNITDCGDEAALWLSEALDMENVRLTRKRPVDEKRVVPVDSYFVKSDASPLRVLDLFALLDFLSDFDIKSSDPVVEEFVQTFRPHLLVYGAAELNEEGSFKINDHFFKVRGRWLSSVGD